MLRRDVVPEFGGYSAAISDLELEFADLQAKFKGLEAISDKIQAKHENLRKRLDLLGQNQYQNRYTQDELRVLRHVVDLVHVEVQAAVGFQKPENESWADFVHRVSRDHFSWFLKRKIHTDLHLLRKGSDSPFQAGNGAEHSPAPEVVERIVQEASVSEPGWARLWQLVAPAKDKVPEGMP